MKEILIFPRWLAALVAAGCLAVLVAATAPLTQTRDLKISNTQNTVKLTIQQPGAQSANAIEIYRGGNLELAVPGTNVAAGLKVKLGIQAGNVVTSGDGTVTQTFATAFSAAPVVVTTQLGLNTTITNVLAVTASTFVLQTSLATQTNNWIALGAP
jgi:hypothetical protein